MVTIKELVDHADKTNSYIHPSVFANLDEWLNNVNVELGGRCPCSYKRPACPCVESIKELEKGDRCCCTVFVNDKYIEKYSIINGGKESFIECTNKLKEMVKEMV